VTPVIMNGDAHHGAPLRAIRVAEDGTTGGPERSRENPVGRNCGLARPEAHKLTVIVETNGVTVEFWLGGAAGPQLRLG
jgi:hypothetical protein